MTESYDLPATIYWNRRYNRGRYIKSTMYNSCYFRSSHSRFMFGVHKEQCKGRSDEHHILSESETSTCKPNVDKAASLNHHTENTTDEQQRLSDS